MYQAFGVMHANALLMQYHYFYHNIAIFHLLLFNNDLLQYCIILFQKMHYSIFIIIFLIF